MSGKKEIYTYEAPWPVYSINWSVKTKPESEFRLALGSFIEEYTNKVEIIQLNNETKKLQKISEFSHSYPPTKIMWSPDQHNDYLATTGDYLRIWNVNDQNRMTEPVVTLENDKKSQYCSPLTSFDWNEADPSMIGTSSIDTCCIIWDINTQQAKTQLIAHDKEVYDIAFSQGKDVFGSVGADGSVRMFDLRNLNHSTIIYESPELVPLLRLEWNKLDVNYLATTFADATYTVILDIRMPSMPVAELGGHTASVNGVAWAPHSACHLCTCGDDSQALIWDLGTMPRPVEDPILVYNAGGAINNLQWSSSQPDWVAIAFDNKIQALRV